MIISEDDAGVNKRSRAVSHVSNGSRLGFVVNTLALGQISSKYCRFPCQFSFILICHLGLVQEAKVAEIPNGLSLKPPVETKAETSRRSQVS
jgi:hypothetical protein